MTELVNRLQLIKNIPSFAALNEAEAQSLAALFQEVSMLAGQVIVKEDDIIDSVYIIVSGEAEVSGVSVYRRKKVIVPVAALRAGESIGLNETGFYSLSGKRTATVTAVTDMTLLRLDLQALYQFLQRYHLESTFYDASLQILRMNFIKQSLPFAKISHTRLQWLAERVEDLAVSEGTVIFKQGDEGDKCYLIRSGEVAIVTTNEKGEERQLALLKPPVLFGEATLITHSPRNASAIAKQDCELLVLKHTHLSELIESEDKVGNMFMTLMVDRSRPIQNTRVTIHHRQGLDGQELTILKNPDNGSYFKLSPEGEFIWQQLDGKNTMQDITLDLAQQFNVFAPDTVAALISRLNTSGFITNLDIDNEHKSSAQPIWVKAMVKIRKILEFRITFGDADQWVTRWYNRVVKYFFTKTGQILLSILAFAGAFAFIDKTSSVLSFFQSAHASLFLILFLIPLSLVEVMLHELGHAFAVKAFGREVHYLGVGWYWFSPIAFTDTSDMWLSARRPRMLVNLAGVYVDILVAGMSALFILIIPNPYIQGLLWLFALYTYIGGFRKLSPLQEMDGYYALMDMVEKNHLRQSAVVWLVKMFPQSLRHPSLFRKHWPEISYWLACLLYLVLVTIIALVLQAFVFNVLGIKANSYFSLLLPFIVVIISSLSIIADIRNQAEE